MAGIDVLGGPFQRMGTTVDGISGTVVVRCECGNKKPLLVPLLPGYSNTGAACNQCGIILSIRNLTFTSEADGSRPSIKVEFNKHIPTIVKPGM